MDQDLKKELSHDTDGLLTYEYIANHIGQCDDIMDELVDNMNFVDGNGQFVVSAARYRSRTLCGGDRPSCGIGNREGP